MAAEELRLSTPELKAGDVILHHGMRVLIEGQPWVGDDSKSPIYRWSGRVLNMEEVKATGHVPLSFLQTWKFEGGWVVDREDVWHVQGNERAMWYVERAKEEDCDVSPILG